MSMAHGLLRAVNLLQL